MGDEPEHLKIFPSREFFKENLEPHISPGSSPKEDGNNSVAKSAMDLQGEEAERRNIHGMVGHVIN